MGFNVLCFLCGKLEYHQIGSRLEVDRWWMMGKKRRFARSGWFLLVITLLSVGAAVLFPLKPNWIVVPAAVGVVLLLGITIAKHRRRNRASGGGDTAAEGESGADSSNSTLVTVFNTVLISSLVYIGGNVVQPVIKPYMTRLVVKIDEWVGNRPLQVATQSWPADPGCDFTTSVAMPVGGPAATSIEYTFQEDPRASVIKRGGASWELGALTFTLTSQRATVHLVAVEPVILSREDNPDIDWILTRTRGCGPGTGHYLRLNLDTSRLYKIVDGKEYPEHSPKGGPGVRGVTITPESPLFVRMQVTSCAARMYTWFLRIRYVSDGQPGVLQIGSEKEPFRSVGGIEGIPIFDISSGEVGEQLQPFVTGKRSSRKCGDNL